MIKRYGTLGRVPKHVHFVGIGGIGMSAVAKICFEMGHRVSGSDLEMNDLTRHLSRLGATIFEGHAASNLAHDTDLVVYSSSISASNLELKHARRLRIPIVQRAYALGLILNPRKGIAVTGTHGKTTTTSLISVMLAKNGFDPTIAIGGEIDFIHSNACLGRGEWMVAEADESDGSFLHLEPFYTVVTNIELEHVDYYRDLDKAIAGYSRFVNKTKKGGALFYNNDDGNIKVMLRRYKGRARNYGLSKGAAVYPKDIKMDRFNTSYTCVFEGKPLGRVDLSIPGIHNVSNSLAAILVGLEMGIGIKEIISSIADFKGAKRRFELRMNEGGVMLIDDYAHHPTEIKAVIEAASNFKRKRLISIFQPHRFTRTKYLKREFGRCFNGVDRLILTDIYASSEKPIRGISVKTIYDEVKKTGLRDVRMVEKEDIPGLMLGESRPGDMIVVMGAGDIKKTASELEDRFKMRLRFKALKGSVVFDAPLARHTTFRIGGRADALIEPIDQDELARAIRICQAMGWKVFLMGNGSNLLVGDGGYRGVVVRLASEAFKDLSIKGDVIRVGGGYSLAKLIRRACEDGLAGLESLIGIPGTVGGAIYMNAGGAAANPIYRTIGEFVRSIKVMDLKGAVKILRGNDLISGYRQSNLEGFIILEAAMRLVRTEPSGLRAGLLNFLNIKRSKQVLDAPSAGCIFKNPSGSPFTAGQLIEMMGFKGARVGGAEISTKHANFIINRGGAAARDVLAIIEMIRKRARDEYGVVLEPEVKVL